MPEWISVKERMPEPGERVLYCYRGFVGEGYVTRSGDWERNGIWTFYYPSHWMPLPEPPEEKANETPSKPKRGADKIRKNKSQKPFSDYSWGDCQGEEGGPRRGSCEMGEA